MASSMRFYDVLLPVLTNLLFYFFPFSTSCFGFDHFCKSIWAKNEGNCPCTIYLARAASVSWMYETHLQNIFFFYIILSILSALTLILSIKKRMKRIECNPNLKQAHQTSLLSTVFVSKAASHANERSNSEWSHISFYFFIISALFLEKQKKIFFFVLSILFLSLCRNLQAGRPLDPPGLQVVLDNQPGLVAHQWLLSKSLIPTWKVGARCKYLTQW